MVGCGGGNSTASTTSICCTRLPTTSKCCDSNPPRHNQFTNHNTTHPLCLWVLEAPGLGRVRVQALAALREEGEGDWVVELVVVGWVRVCFPVVEVKGATHQGLEDWGRVCLVEEVRGVVLGVAEKGTHRGDSEGREQWRVAEDSVVLLAAAAVVGMVAKGPRVLLDTRKSRTEWAVLLTR